MMHDAIVIGGGPAGATAALMLARAGWSVALIEKAIFPRRKVCGEFISATSLPLLNEIGIADEFLSRAGPQVRQVGFFSKDTSATAPMPESHGSCTPWGRALGREHLDLMLLEAAARAGARIWQPWTVSALHPRADGHVCTIAHKGLREQINARIVIAATGSWERNDWVIAPNSRQRPSDLLAFKAHFEDSDLAPGLMPLLMFPGGYGGMAHSDGGRVTLSCCIRRQELQQARELYKAPHAGNAVLSHIAASCLGVREALAPAQLAGAWLSAGPIRPGIRNRYADGIFRIGNVAGEAHPIVAEGISMAMQSAWLLCRQLIASQEDLHGRKLSMIGRKYSSEWTRWFAPRIRAAAVFANMAFRPTFRALLRPVVQQFPGVLTFGARLSGKATVVIPSSSGTRQ